MEVESIPDNNYKQFLTFNFNQNNYSNTFIQVTS